MCLTPIMRPNPNYHVQGIFSYIDKSGQTVKVPVHNSLSSRVNAVARVFGKDADNRFIYVPCGHCPECIAARQNALVQRAEVESKTHHIFFCTLTYDNSHLPKLQVQIPKIRKTFTESECIIGPETLFSSAAFDEEREISAISVEPCYDDGRIENLLSFAASDLSSDWSGILEDITPSQESGFVDSEPWYDQEYESIEFPYADIHDVQLLLKNLRDNLPKNPVFGNRDLKYLAVSELGKTNGRPHFHILFFVEKKPEDIGFGGRITQMYTLENVLYHAVFKYWAHNVGTRKNPVYEKLFTYRRRFYGNRVYTNFDLHWVDPSRSRAGTRNVAYYVTKYLLKGSEKEVRRQQFLRLNLQPSEYSEVWSKIKCKCTISKGLGLNARFETFEVKELDYVAFDAVGYSALLDSFIEGDDLPPDCIPNPVNKVYRVRKKRVMIPDWDVVEKLRHDLILDVGKAPGPIYIDGEGKHRPLARYYQNHGYIYMTKDFLDIYLNYDDRLDHPSYLLSIKEKQKKFYQHSERINASERNSTFDTSPALLWGSDVEDNNSYHISF